MIALLLILFQDNGDLDRLLAAVLNHDWPDAARRAELYVRGHPESIEGWTLRGRSLNHLESYEEALPALQKAEALGAKDGVFFFDLGMAELHAGSADDAVAHLTKAAESLPAPAPAIYLRGHAHLKRKAWADAIADFNRAAELEPKFRQPCDLFAAQALKEQGDEAEAKKRAEAAKNGPLPELSKAAELLTGARFSLLNSDDYAINLRLAAEPVKNAIYLGRGLPTPTDFGRRNDWRGVLGFDGRARFWKSGLLSAEASDSFTLTRYRDISDFNDDLNLLSLELKWDGRPVSVRLRPEWNYERRDNDPFLSEWAIGVGADYHWNPDSRTALDLKGSSVDYYGSVPVSELDRDGTTTRIALSQNFRGETWWLRLHLAASRTNTEGSDYDETQTETGVLATLDLPWEIKAAGRLVFQVSLHDNPSVINPAGPERHDQSWIAGVELSRRVWGPVVAVIGFSVLENRSNYDEWTYRTSSLTFGFELR